MALKYAGDMVSEEHNATNSTYQTNRRLWIADSIQELRLESIVNMTKLGAYNTGYRTVALQTHTKRMPDTCNEATMKGTDLGNGMKSRWLPHPCVNGCGRELDRRGLQVRDTSMSSCTHLQKDSREMVQYRCEQTATRLWRLKENATNTINVRIRMVDKSRFQNG